MEKFYTDLPHSVVARANQVNNGKLNALRWVFVSPHGQVNTFQIW
jgi:hypothetical protein